jgi:hypothetical protein
MVRLITLAILPDLVECYLSSEAKSIAVVASVPEALKLYPTLNREKLSERDPPSQGLQRASLARRAPQHSRRVISSARLCR